MSDQPAAATRERKWQPQALKAQEIKRAKVPYDIGPDILRYAKEGWDSIPPEDRNSRFRWWGLYTQADGQGIPKGATEAVTAPYFMLRIKVPGGHLRGHQLREIAKITREFARGFGDVTTRQDIQLHWIRIEHVPEILERLHTVGVFTWGA